MLDGANSFYGEVPRKCKRGVYTGRFKVVNPEGTVLQIGINCYWYWLQGIFYVRSNETDNLLNSWSDPNELLRIIVWPEETRDWEL